MLQTISFVTAQVFNFHLEAKNSKDLKINPNFGLHSIDTVIQGSNAAKDTPP